MIDFRKRESWTKQPYEISTKDGKAVVLGWTAGSFGIHGEKTEGAEQVEGKYAYSVDHLPTGCRIAAFFSPDNAREFVAQIDPLADWAKVENHQPEMADIGSKIKGIARQIEP